MFYKARNNTLYQDVVNQICQMILDGKINRGELLPSEQKLCEQFEVSRTTVREALSILSQMKVIKTIRGKGSVVISDDLGSLSESIRHKYLQYESNFNHATQARQMLEPQIAYYAAQIATKKDIDELQEIIDICDEKTKNHTISTVDLRKFHIRVAQIIKNPVISGFVESLISMCDADPDIMLNVPNPNLETAEGVAYSHESILQAIKEHNSEDAYFYMKENLKDFKQNCLNEY